MKLKQLTLIVAFLAGLSAVVFLVRRPAPPLSADARLDQPVLDAATAEKIAEIRLSDAGKSLVAKRDASGTWHVPAYFDFPADFQKIARFVSELTEAKLTRLVTTSPERIARLEFKDTQITLLDASAKELWTVTLGKSADTGGRFLRYGAESKAYLAPLNTSLDLEPKNWANTELLTLKPDDIAKLEIPFAEGGPVTFTRAKNEAPWIASSTPAGQKLKPDALAPILNALTGLRFTDTTDLTEANAVAAKARARVFNLETFDKKTIKVAIGRKPEEKKIKPPVYDKTLASTTPGSSELVGGMPSSRDPSPAKLADPKPLDPKLLAPEFETIPAGPVFVTIITSDEKSSVNALMQKRAFQIADYNLTGLPQKSADFFAPAPATASPTPESKKNEK